MEIKAIERAVTAYAGELLPINPRQVILALNSHEYADLLDFDKNTIGSYSVRRALKRLAAEFIPGPGSQRNGREGR